MTQEKINKAYPALMRLCGLRLPIKKARKLYASTVKMKEYFDFALSEEQKYVEDFDGTMNPDGTVSFPSPEKFVGFQDRITELNESEVDWEIEPVIITELEVGDQQVSVNDIIDLEGFVIFE